MEKILDFKLDRTIETSLAEQIRIGITAAIDSGVLAPGARLPSWLDLAAQLGVARGTVKTAYERLVDKQLVVSSSPGGTRVADHPAKITFQAPFKADLLPPLYQDFLTGTSIFQNGVPSSDSFPVTLFARLRASAARAELSAPLIYPDPRGESELRCEIAAHLALSRGIKCRPSQIFITAGFSGALGITLRILNAEGQRAWVENPGFPPSRRALEIARLTPVPIAVDEDGIDVAYGIQHAADAALALVTPGQQAPTGVPLSFARRVKLIEWATHTGAWIIEDDYLGELQLKRRAAPALTSLDSTGRVIHIGSFSKTISPTLRLGFVVAPTALVSQFAEAVMCLAPAPGPAVQLATAELMRNGHYMRHLRRMKRVYAGRSNALHTMLQSMGYPAHPAGLGVLLWLPEGARDSVIAREALAFGLAPSPISAWFSPLGVRRSGLLLGVATADEDQFSAACDRLHQLIRTFS
ncbi:Transcriptional regulator containing a DNA-binding HTH domain and an aminotransferase domain (MocR family) [Candidatus Nitrotoga sp. HW29]|uniref:MocR-like pyridoxine biosynthesis transcription factor PdxR n=1 Tax=Candidatus Nitrotoga sp. HW29 TaxID=2886963 RepID=UPI001EF20806|nr:PLP-dependent aminotransferase family protein [Candidatus Nitrotoga sp. HW29]CAH1904287.1 Transcriptional regulator containing a DNA-binding HTH domain and an aminotransferase domain (MocR family) [Candidatus Nitrotoga sp. HW29]